MAFSFAIQPQDYALRAQAGLSLDPSMGDPAVTAQAQQVAAAPSAQMPQQQPVGLPDIKVSAPEAIMAWLMHGGTPGEAAQSVRAVKRQNVDDAYALQRNQMLMDSLRGATPQQRQAMLFNAAKYGESVAKNFEPINAAEGTTETLFGGASQPGGSSSIAPKLMLGPAGQPIALTQNGTVSLGPQLAGKKTAANGVVMDDNLGVIGNYATPQTVAPGATLNSFQPGYSAGAGGPSATPTNPIGPPGKFDAANFIKSFILPHEGGLNPHDMNGAASKFGINAKANPGVDVPNLTADQAAAIYQNKYLPMSGAADLPPALAAVHLDTSIINPSRAHEFLVQSGGDPAKYMQLRQAWMDHMVQTNPAAAPYAAAWNQRNTDLGKLISGGAASQASPQGGAPTVVSNVAQGRQPRTLTSQEAQAAGFAPGAVVQQDAEGKLAVAQAPEYGPEAKSSLRNHVLTSDEYKQAQASLAAYKAMIANAGTMTGPSAYSMLDTFARAINPGAVARPTVIQTIEQNLGLPAQLVGSLESKFGKGNLPPEVRQQIIDAVIPFAQTHWDQARMLNDSNAELAKSHGFKAEDVTAPLEERPQRMVVTPDGAISEPQALAQARQAIARGAPRDKVIGRLQALHIRPAGL